ncbi:MAG: tetratricopeptide repeat protein [Anaerolineae bacterium]|nr:tetratricopeptide repeat protein [Anaerolineae bacterium]
MHLDTFDDNLPSDMLQKIDTLNALARELRNIDPSGGLAYSQKAYVLSQAGFFAEKHYRKGMAASLLLQGICNHQLGNYRQALSLLFDAQDFADTLEDRRLHAEVMLNIAETYNILGDLPVALEYVLTAIKKCKEAGCQENEAGAHRLVGDIHRKLGNHQQALAAFQKSVQTYRDIGNKPGEATLLNDIAVQHCSLSDFEPALDSARRSLKLARQLHLDMLEANVLCTTGEIYLARGDVNQTLDFFQRSIDLARRLGFTYLEMYALTNAGQFHLGRDQVDKALSSLLTALEIAEKIDTRSDLYRCHQLLAQAYRQKGDFESALHHHEQYHRVYQTVFNEESDRRIRNLQIAHDTETAQKSAEIYRLRNVELEREITQRMTFEEELQQAHDRLLALRRVDIDLTSRLDVDHVLSEALKAAIRLSGAAAGAIWQAEGDDFRLVQRDGCYPEDLIGLYLPSETGVYGRVVRERESAILPAVDDDPEYVSIVEGMSALLVLPLVSRQALIGILSLETSQPGGFPPDTLDTLNLLAGRIAIAIDNARAYEELESLVEELDAFAHMVAHDLKYPLSMITGYAGLLLEDHPTMPEDELHEMLQRVIDGALEMSTIIDALLLLAGIRALGEVDITDLDMSPLVENVRLRLAPLIDEHHAEIRLPSRWPLARGYAPWIEEVWSNYLSNALKYGGDPSVIELGAALQSDNMIRFWVHDNGPGLTPEEQERLFTPFTRLKQVQVEGHGLGLSIARRIVEKLGGQVGVESKPGAGSTFSFTLPAASPTD